MKNEKIKMFIGKISRGLRRLQITSNDNSQLLDDSNKKDYAHKIMKVSNAIKR